MRGIHHISVKCTRLDQELIGSNSEGPLYQGPLDSVRWRNGTPGTLPLMNGARHYAEQWIFPGGSSNNKATFEGQVRFAETIRDEERMLLFDAQTSGGLLIALPEDQLSKFQAEMDQRGAAWWRIGHVSEPQAARIFVER